MIVAKRGEKYCTNCGLPGPPEKMKRSLCPNCQIQLGQDAAAAARREQTEAALKRMVSSLRGNSIDVPHISELTSQMIKRFGGLEQMTVEWKHCIDAAIKANPGGKTVLDQFYALAKLTLMSTEHRQSAPDMANVSDADLDAEVRALVEEICPGLKVFDEGSDDDAESLIKSA